MLETYGGKGPLWSHWAQAPGIPRNAGEWLTLPCGSPQNPTMSFSPAVKAWKLFPQMAPGRQLVDHPDSETAGEGKTKSEHPTWGEIPSWLQIWQFAHLSMWTRHTRLLLSAWRGATSVISYRGGYSNRRNRIKPNCCFLSASWNTPAQLKPLL